MTWMIWGYPNVLETSLWFYDSYPFLMPLVYTQTWQLQLCQATLVYIYIYIHYIYIYLLSTSRSNLWSEQKLETHTSGSPRHDSIPAFLAKIGDFIIHDMRIPMNQPWFNHYNSMTDGFEHSSHLYDVHTMCITSNIYTCECHSNIMHMCMLHILHICIEYYRIYIQ